MKIFLSALALATLAVIPADAASLNKSYSYFSIGGRTLGEIEDELGRRGPQLNGTGRRHPGATRMQFATKVTYGQVGTGCGVTKASVTLDAKVILPRWRNRQGSEQETRVIWDTLSNDIKRHEESHIVIARNYARELENRLSRVRGHPTCEAAAAQAKAISDDVLSRHDREQIRFDQIEGINFERRIMRLLEYRLQRMSDGRLPG
jgi:predicted secreted Zn-dependent protease